MRGIIPHLHMPPLEPETAGTPAHSRRERGQLWRFLRFSHLRPGFRLLLWAGLVVVLVVVGLGAYAFLRRDYLRENGLELLGVSLREVQVQQGVVSGIVELSVRSRFPFPLPVDSVVFSGLFSGSRVLNGTATQTRLWPGTNRVISHAFFRVGQYRNRITALKAVDSAATLLLAQVFYSLPFYASRYDTRAEGRMRVPTPPQFRLGKITYRDINNTEHTLDLEAELFIDNPGMADIIADSVYYRVFFGDMASASGALPKALHVRPGQTERVVLPLSVSLDRAGKLVRLALSKDTTRTISYRIELEGQLTLPNAGLKRIPLAISTTDTFALSALYARRDLLLGR